MPCIPMTSLGLTICTINTLNIFRMVLGSLLFTFDHVLILRQELLLTLLSDDNWPVAALRWTTVSPLLLHSAPV